MLGSRKRAHQIVIGPHSTEVLETMFAPSVYSGPGVYNTVILCPTPSSKQDQAFIWDRP